MKIKQLIVIFALTLSLSACTSSPTSTPSVSSSSNHYKSDKIVFYSINDTHGAIEENLSTYVAGIAKLKDIIYHDTDYSKENSVILSSGDMFQGTGLSNLTKGKAMTQIMETFPFDAMAIGNHEFDWGLKNLLENIKNYHSFPILNSNIFEGENLIENTQPSIIVEKGGYKIGIIGSIQSGIESSIAYNQVKNYTIKEDAPLVVSEAEKLKEQGADLVVLSTHQGLTSSVKSMANSGKIDAFFLGHTHAVIDENLNGIPVVEAGANSTAFSKVVFQSEKGILKLKSQEIKQVTKEDISKAKVDGEVQKIIDSANKDVKPILEEKIVRTNGSFSRYQNPSFPNNGSMGQLITKSMFEYGEKIGLENLVAVHNTGGVRKDFICSSNTECTMTYGDLYEISPFDNEVRYVKVKGSDLYSAIKSHYYYGYNESSIDRDAVYNVLTIDYLTTTPGYPLYSEDGGFYPNNEIIYIRDMLKSVLQSKDILYTTDYSF